MRVQAFAATAEDLDALEGHPLDAEDEQQVDAVPRCMESVMLDAEDGEERAAAMQELEELGAEVLGLQVRAAHTRTVPTRHPESLLARHRARLSR